VGAKWYYEYREGFVPNFGYYTLESIKDTILQQKKCKLIKKTYYRTNGKIENQGEEIIYNDANKVYHYFKGNFYIIYDFSLKPGDIMKIKEPDLTDQNRDVFFNVKIDSVGNTTINNTKLRWQFISEVNRTCKWAHRGKVIEGIGSLIYFFPHQSLDCDGLGPEPLRCYTDNILTLRHTSVSCDSIIKFTEISNVVKSKFCLYPNPIENVCTIDCGDEKMLNIFIVNTLGTIVYKKQRINQSKIILVDLNKIQRGIYFATVTSDRNTYSIKIIRN
jgi:hypothetical protein